MFEHLFYAQTKKSPAILKTLTCSTVYPSFTCSVKLVRSEVTFYIEELCCRKCVINFGFRNVVGTFKCSEDHQKIRMNFKARLVFPLGLRCRSF